MAHWKLQWPSPGRHHGCGGGAGTAGPQRGGLAGATSQTEDVGESSVQNPGWLMISSGMILPNIGVIIIII